MHYMSLCIREEYCLLCSFVETIEGMNLQAGFLNHTVRSSDESAAELVRRKNRRNARFRLGLLRAFQTHDEGDFHLQFLSSLDDTLRDVITAHDAAEDVDENALHFRVRVQDFECLLDGLGCSASVKISTIE